MAKQEQLDLLKRGVREWNQWRDTNPYTRIDLCDADLRAAPLSGAYLYRADLSRTRLNGANLRGADLRAARLSGARLGGARLNGANLRGADLREADLRGADLRAAELRETNLRGADLSDAILSEAYFSETDLSGTSLSGTVLGGMDLREASGLETVQHRSPSYISIDTIYRSEGQIPEDFLRGAGVPDTFIEYMRSLVVKAIDFYACSISYASEDEAFAQHLYADLQQEGVRCWLAPEQMKIGDKMRHRIDESIRFSDKLLVVLSQHSVASNWVQHEVEAAFERERQRGGQVLFALTLDEAIQDSAQAWAMTIRRSKHIGDFTRWKQHDDYQRAFERVLRDVKT
jgi:TIR domain/Pentapeptide repeats (8 copies)